MITDTSFPSRVRLHRPCEFAAALRGKRLARGTFFTVSAASVVPRPGYALPSAKLGLVIAKRFAARSVTRNTIKRVVREAFRHARDALPPADYIVRLSMRIPPLSLTALKKRVRTEVDAHFTKVAQK